MKNTFCQCHLNYLERNVSLLVGISVRWFTWVLKEGCATPPILGYWSDIPKGKKFSRELIFANFFFGHFAGINFRELGFTEDFAGINFRELSLTKDFAGINFRESALFKDFAGPQFMVLKTISVKINTFLLIKMTKQSMVSRRGYDKAESRMNRWGFVTTCGDKWSGM